jgi:hypothetical protein
LWILGYLGGYMCMYKDCDPTQPNLLDAGLVDHNDGGVYNIL